MEQQERIGLQAKRILDWGRIEYLNEHAWAFQEAHASTIKDR